MCITYPKAMFTRQQTLRNVFPLRKSSVRDTVDRGQDFRTFFLTVRITNGGSSGGRWQETNESRANANEANRVLFATTV